MDSLKELQCADWHTVLPAEASALSLAALECGQILYLPQLPFKLLPHEERCFSLDIADLQAKNISFTLATDKLSGVPSALSFDLRQMMKRYAGDATHFIKALFPSYAPHLEIGRTSFRPAEILGRKTSYRKDDTRLHVDAFPATPNQGRRILRIFTNIHPTGKKRVWRVGDTFPNVAATFLPQIKKAWPGKSALLKACKITKSYRTEYDHIMLQIHDLMKKDVAYQKSVRQSEIQFPSGASWIVQTDQVSHAAMSGQHVLEQTFYLPVQAMKNPEFSPLKVLERILNKTLSESR